MKVRLCDFLPHVGLVVVAYLQGCASNPAEVKAVPVGNKEQAKVVKPVVSKEGSSPLTDAPATTLPPAEPSVNDQSAPPLVSAPAVEPLPRKPTQVEPIPPAPVVRVEPKPAAKPVSKPEPQPVAVATTPAPKLQSSKPVQTSPPKPAPQTPVAAPPAIAEPQSEPNEPKPESAEPAVMETDVEVTMESLPITIHGQWVLTAADDACNLSTVPVRFDDGQGISKLQLVLTSEYWLIKTQSDIDLSYSGTGLKVDEEIYFPIAQVVRESDLKFTKDYAAMTGAFMTGKNLRITLGFWPTWPVTETKTIDVPLQHFARAHRAWKQCLSLINGR